MHFNFFGETSSCLKKNYQPVDSILFYQKNFLKLKILGKKRRTNVSIKNALVSLAALFSFKLPSLLKFGEYARNDCNEQIKLNLKNIFQIENIPSDTTMREIIDEIPTNQLFKPFKKIFALIQRGKNLEEYVFLDKKYLISLDGTGFSSSHKVHCENCCCKEHRDGSKTYYHQDLAGVLIHPDKKTVIPISPEPIIKQNGLAKNDCERNAAFRILERLRREHPHLQAIITEDGLSSNSPHIEYLKHLRFGFILGCKPGDHKYLFNFLTESEKLNEVSTHEIIVDNIRLCLRYMNEIYLNNTKDTKINFLECIEHKKDGSKSVFSWVTDIPITNENAYQIMKGGRARWKIENETFNTLKIKVTTLNTTMGMEIKT